MKKIILSIAYFFAGIFFIQAQVLFGVTYKGGAYGEGTIIKFIPATNNLIVAKSFGSNITDSGSEVGASLMQASDGKLYGCTVRGGIYSYGIIFSFDPSSFTYKKLMDFDDNNGAAPIGYLMQASDGKLYGFTGEGGSGNFGVLYSFDPSASTYTKLLDFDGTKGTYPYGSLIQASDGKLYGMTQYGGSNDYGVIFSFDPLAATYTKLKDFDVVNGAQPLGSLMQASDRKLYGMTLRGGSSDSGVLFSFDLLASTYTKLVDFDNAKGSFPDGNLIQASDGKLYGVTYKGGSSGNGVMFSFNPLTSTYTRLKDFDYANGDGANPHGSLIQASDGRLYGMTMLGGSTGRGIIYSFDPLSSTYTKLQDFDGTNGAHPYSKFIEVHECITKTTYYRDADGDGYGNLNDSLKACAKPAGYVKNNTDCNDNNAAIHAPVTYYRDKDKDGYGDASHSISVCESVPPAGYVTNNYDCEDYDRPGHGRDDRVVMCHHGKEQCVKVKEINKKLQQGWTLGPCNNACGTGNEKLPGKQQSIPGEYKLSNYPNPFSDNCTIQYELPFDSKVSIKVYDILGRPVAVLVNEDKKAGVYTINFKAANSNKNLLFLRIIATSNDQQFEQTNRLVQVQ